MNKESIKKVYKRYSSIYDKIFGFVFEKGRKEIIKNLNLKKDDIILEIGVGTGLSLNKYPKNTFITGIDISEEMLQKAKEKVKKYNLSNIELKIEDAEEIDYSTNKFDKVVIMYVLSVTPNPEKLIEKAIEQCKDDGEVIIVNHFSNRSFLNKYFSKNKIDALAKKLGFRFYFPLEKYIKYIRHLGYNNIKTKSTNYKFSNIITIKKEQ